MLFVGADPLERGHLTCAKVPPLRLRSAACVVCEPHIRRTDAHRVPGRGSSLCVTCFNTPRSVQRGGAPEMGGMRARELEGLRGALKRCALALPGGVLPLLNGTLALDVRLHSRRRDVRLKYPIEIRRRSDGRPFKKCSLNFPDQNVHPRHGPALPPRGSPAQSNPVKVAAVRCARGMPIGAAPSNRQPDIRVPHATTAAW